MNRSVPTDSKLSLDVRTPIADSAAMIAAHRPLYAERRDPACNVARFYTLSIEPSLFGEACLIRHWGRIGTHGQTKTVCFASEDEATQQLAEIHRKKAKRGYRERSTAPG